MKYKAVGRNGAEWASARIETQSEIVVSASPAWRTLVGQNILTALYAFKRRGLTVWVRASDDVEWVRLDLSAW
jgi:hypothetical protein